jgi:hypothetical protein
MSLGVRFKDPQETRLFTMDWTLDLDGQTITTSVWAVETGITKVSDAIVSGNLKTSILLSGGTALTDYTVTNTITIAATSEVLERSGVVAVRQQ